VLVFLIAFTGMAYADRNVKTEPEIQGLATSTGMNVQGTITETDAGAWSVNANGIPLSGDDPVLTNYPWASSSWGSYANFLDDWHSFLDAIIPNGHLQDMLNYETDPAHQSVFQPSAADLLNWLQNQGSPLTPPL
jgi:hypothetical protein